MAGGSAYDKCDEALPSHLCSAPPALTMQPAESSCMEGFWILKRSLPWLLRLTLRLPERAAEAVESKRIKAKLA